MYFSKRQNGVTDKKMTRDDAIQGNTSCHVAFCEANGGEMLFRLEA